MLLSLALAAAAALVGSTQAQGTAHIFNYCDKPINLWAVDAQRNPQSPTAIANGSSYSEAYHTLATGGVSLKLGWGNSLYDMGNAITQFEYTLTGGFIWYDISNVNCQGNACPFATTGMHLETTDPACPSRTCSAGEVPCSGAYTLYNDDWNSLACGPAQDIKLYICATGNSAPAAAARPAASPAAASSAAAPSASSSSVPVQKMEAIMDRKMAKREDGMRMHRHMRRHMHAH